MELRELLSRVAASWDRSLGTKGDSQELLRKAGTIMKQWLPAGYVPAGSGGKGAAAHCPWIAVFDPDETLTAQEGMYVVYLFAGDMNTVSLTLNQGVTALSTLLGTPMARTKFAEQAAKIRASFAPDAIADLDTSIDLRVRAELPTNYERANIFSITYELADLPSEQILRQDLRRFLRIYDEALDSRSELRGAEDAGATAAPTPKKTVKKAAEFKPKNDADYRQTIAAREINKSRKHETLLTDYVEFLKTKDYVPANNVHPRDLTAERAGVHWLIEAKMVKAGNGVSAARDAFSQLFFYRRFHYDPADQVSKLALFSEHVGSACTNWLMEHSIAVVWKSENGWSGCPVAVEAGLAN